MTATARSESRENYLTAILRLEEAGTAASTSALAAHLGVAPASVTGMLKKLARQGLVVHRRYRGVQLTRRGHEVALAVVRRHRLVETFLVRTLGLAPDRVHEEAHRWEHVLSDDVVERLDLWLGLPRRDPHGTPIPRESGAGADSRPLTMLAAGDAAVVLQAEGSDGPHAAYLRSLGLKTGAAVTVVEQRPFGGPVTLDVDGQRCVVGREVTGYVTVQEDVPGPQQESG